MIGGRVTISIETSKDTSITEAMLNSPNKPLTGRLHFYDAETEALIRTVEFRSGYLVYYKEVFIHDKKRQLYVTFTVSANVLIIGDALMNNRW